MIQSDRQRTANRIAGEANAASASASLRAAELRADRLSAGIRGIVFLSLAAVFASIDVGLEHRTYVALSLAVYGAVALGAIGLAWRRVFHPALAYALVTLDVALVIVQLMLLARLFALPHAAVYSIPAAGLIFVVLAHAALRFRPALILYAAALFVGLLEGSRLVLGSVDSAAHAGEHPQEPFIYGHALPLSVIALVALALWAGGAESRRTLERAIANARRAASLSRFFSPAVADRLAVLRAGASATGDRRKVAILFVDMQGFTALGQSLTPDALARFLTEFRSTITGPVFQLAGSIDKFVGDGALVVFGSPEQRPDDGARAIACGRMILDAVASWSRQREAGGEAAVRVGIGGHYGEVFAGVVGVDEQLEFTVIGDAVNIAERIERLTRMRHDDLIVSEELLRAANLLSDPLWRRLPDQALPGHGGNITLFAMG